MTDKIEKILNELNKTYGANTIGRLKDMPTIKTERVSTGSPYLDWATGGGWPLGRTIELYGPFSSGKSLISLRTIVEFQKLGKQVAYLDSENAFDPAFAEVIGVNTKDLIISQISSGEEVFNIIDKLLETEIALIVVDSVASLVPLYEEENEMEKQTIGIHARMMSKAMRRITGKTSKNKTLILFINQIREKVGSYGNPETTTGGRALGFYASLRVDVRRGELMEENKRIIGQHVKFKVTKSKVSPPFRDGYFIFYHPDLESKNKQVVFDDADELVSMLLIQGIIKRRGAWYDVLGKSFQGREELEAEIRKDDKFKEELKKLWQEK
jgi:recombination protein RecA